jgi:hypothetical protein
VGLSGELGSEPRLAHSGLALDDCDAATAIERLGPQLTQLDHRLLTPDERTRGLTFDHRWQLDRRRPVWRRGRTGHGRGALGSNHLPRRRGSDDRRRQPALVRQDRRLEAHQIGRQVEAELVEQHATGAIDRPQCICLTAVAIQRDRQL